MLFLSLALAVAPPPPGLLAYGTGDGHDGQRMFMAADAGVAPPASRLSFDAPAGATTLSLQDPSGFAVGSLVLIWQVNGAPEPVPGQGLDLGDAGTFQLRRVVGQQLPNDVVVDRALDALAPAASVQVMVVPEYTNVGIEPGAVVQVPPWDGELGGALVLMVDGQLTNMGTIDGTGAGFRGGVSINDPISIDDCEGDRNPRAGLGGEGLHGMSGTGSAPWGTGGGGGNCLNSGGGGGALAGRGGHGGFTWFNERDVGGEGGLALASLPTPPDRLVLGGGGGSGHITIGGDGDGAPGGGLLVVIARRVGNLGTIDVRGADGSYPGTDGGGGGGAGGMVAVLSTRPPDCVAIDVGGGDGASTSDFGGNHGPGGGGGGGLLYMSPPPAQGCQPTALGGSNGLSGTVDYGAISGADGRLIRDETVRLDADGDSFLVDVDCDDEDPDVQPGADEVCGNGVDDDCDGAVDEGCGTTTDTPTDTGTEPDPETASTGDTGPVAAAAVDGCACGAAGGWGSWLWVGWVPLVLRRRVG